MALVYLRHINNIYSHKYTTQYPRKHTHLLYRKAAHSSYDKATDGIQVVVVVVVMSTYTHLCTAVPSIHRTIHYAHNTTLRVCMIHTITPLRHMSESSTLAPSIRAAVPLLSCTVATPVNPTSLPRASQQNFSCIEVDANNSFLVS